MGMDKKKAVAVTIGIVAFLFSFSVGNIAEVLFQNYYIGQYGLFGMPVFVAFLAYIIVKFRAFNIKILSSQIFVFSLWFLVLAILFVRKIENVRWVVVPTLILVAILGYILVKAVKKEVEQKEELAILATSLQATNQKLETANIRLQELDKQKSEFLDIASHQLRTPLSALIGLLSMQYDGDFDSLSKAEAKEQQQRMLISADRLKNIIHDLMDAMEVELGAKLKPAPTDVAKLAQEAIDTLRPNYEKKNLYLKYSPPDKPLPLVSADPSFLAHVFMNLIDNACNYTEAGGAEIKLCQENNQVIFQITDTGIGVTAAEKENLFGKFIRAKRAMLVRPDGSGLGLFIVKKIVEAHGGKIELASDGENKGATFKVYLPIKS